MKKLDSPILDLDELLFNFRAKLRIDLPKAELMSPEEIQNVFFVYRDWDVRNFVPWLAATWSRCVSHEAREACRTNLICELRENHLEVYLDYISQLSTKESRATFSTAAVELEQVSLKLDQLMKNPIEGLVVMAALEAASVEFMPWLKTLGNRLNLKDLRYVTIHMEIDDEHTDVFSKAWKAEVQYQERKIDPTSIVRAIELVDRFFSLIFNARFRS
jgi:hypothetical protein